MRTFQALRPSDRGFTLLEISVVLVIIGFMAVMLYPRLSGLLAEEDLRATAMRLAGTIERIRAQAAATKRPYRLNYSLDANQVSVSALSDDGFTYDSSVIAGQKGFPEGVYLADVHTALGLVTHGEAFTTFYPSGYVDPCAIHLTDARGRVYSLIVNTLTGRTTIYDRRVDQREIPDPSKE